jgi:hypothetical protein
MFRKNDFTFLVCIVISIIYLCFLIFKISAIDSYMKSLNAVRCFEKKIVHLKIIFKVFYWAIKISRKYQRHLANFSPTSPTK